MKDSVRKTFLLLSMTLIGLSMSLSIYAKATAQAEPLVDCEVFANPGNIKIWRCMDPDTNKVIYQNQMGFMFVGEW